MSRHYHALKKVLYTPVKDASPTSFHGETRCLTREARAIIRFINTQELLPVYELADAFNTKKRAVERVISNEYNRSRVQADNVEEDQKHIHPTLLEMLQDWIKKTKKQIKKDRKISSASATSTEARGLEESSISVMGKSKKAEAPVQARQPSVTQDVDESKSVQKKRRRKKDDLPSPPPSTMSPSPCPPPSGMVTRKRGRVTVISDNEQDPERPTPSAKRVRHSLPQGPSPSPPPSDSDSDDAAFKTLLAFFRDLNYVPSDLRSFYELGLGPAELLLARTLDTSEVERYFGDILQAYCKPIVVRTLARVVRTALDKHWKILEKAAR